MRHTPDRRSPLRTPGLCRSVAALVLALAGAEAQAGMANEDDLPFVPDWCRAIQFVWDKPDPRLQNDKRVQAELAKLTRTGCNGIWHYCWGMINRNRAFYKESDPDKKKGFLGASVGDFDYVVEHSASSCSLIPDAIVKQGDSWLLSGEYQKAEERFRKALKVAPGIPGAYIGLCDIYEQLGDLDRAVATLEEGIKANPKSSQIKKKLERVKTRAPAGGTAAAPGATTAPPAGAPRPPAAPPAVSASGAPKTAGPPPGGAGRAAAAGAPSPAPAAGKPVKP